ncbi:MAG: hypothetical protein ACRDYY_01590 [Acidimicrobiales bacterium]
MAVTRCTTSSQRTARSPTAASKPPSNEREWEEQKRRENAEAPESLAELLQEVAPEMAAHWATGKAWQTADNYNPGSPFATATDLTVTV